MTEHPTSSAIQHGCVAEHGRTEPNLRGARLHRRPTPSVAPLAVLCSDGRGTGHSHLGPGWEKEPAGLKIPHLIKAMNMNHMESY